jgi:hypothetical protein
MKIHPVIPSRHRLLAYLLLAVWLLPQLCGCGLLVVGGAAAGTAAYVSGDLSATLDADLAQSLKAADAAIKENKIIQVSRTVDGLGAAYVLRTHQDDKIEINLKETTAHATAITIRVGLFGDEPLSHKILDEIQARLR